jgi:hypothetical protein
VVDADLQGARLLSAARIAALSSKRRKYDAEIPRASWYYDEHQHRLGYRVGRHTRFKA